MDLKDFTVVCGHYGCGKTNFSINLAIDLANSGRKVTLADMDLVNPYFRTSDFREVLESRGIEVVAPVYGHTNLDIPAIDAALYGLFENHDAVIIDAGGDDVGATVLGRFHEQFAGKDYDMLYLVNRYRNLTQEPADAVAILKEIEAASRLKATKVLNNSHLKASTVPATIEDALEYGREA
ncbi:MAG: ParA family protein, partial [Lachnospiraceae bacterium]|nr:ParA family protein [Lachnospiraceae bacterium]